MNKITLLLSGLTLCGALALPSCRDFDEVNTNPQAASQEQVLSEYLINKAVINAQQDPHIAERAFVLYWKTAGHQHRSSGLSTGSFNNGWSSDYYARVATEGLKPIYAAIALSEKKIKEGSAKDYETTLLAVARVWRVYLLSELCDNFGVVALDGYTGTNPTYVGAKEAYAFFLKELKEASAILKTAPSVKDKAVKDLDQAYGFDAKKWRAYANSLWMRLSMRLSEVDPATAKANFEEAAAAGGILDAAGRFQVIEKEGWHELTGVMSREWNAQFVSPTYSNLVLGLGGISSKHQVTDKELLAKVKDDDYIGVRYDKHFPLKTTDPSRGFYLDGLPGTIDPRAYKTFIIAGHTADPEFCFYPSWNKLATTVKYDLKTLEDKTKTLDSLDATGTWNVWAAGEWGDLSAINTMVQIGTMPRLANKYRNSKNTRIFFAEWETYFLLAEASVRGWSVGIDGKDAYEKGIRANLAYHGVEKFADDYLASTAYNRVGTSVAWNHTTEPGATRTMKCIDGYTKQSTSYTFHYPPMQSRLYTQAMNDRLTKIITQKFIANTPWLPLETWSDFRRLGLPFFETPAVENQLDNMPQLTASTYQQVKVNFFPQRLPLPSKIENGNLAGHAAALKALGGEDKVFTVLYWAKH